MAVCLSNSHYMELLKILQENYNESHQAHDMIENVINGKIAHVEVKVDKWPDFNILLVRPTGLEPEYLVYKYITIYTRNNFNMKSSLTYIDLVHPGSSYLFIILQTSTAEVVQEILRTKYNLNVPQNVSISLRLDEEDLNVFPAGDGMILTPIPDDLIHIVQESWSYADEVTREYFIYLKQNYNSLVLYDTDSSLIGFVMETHHGTLGMLYVVPEKRGRGYSKILLSNICKNIFTSGRKVCFSSVHVDNMASLRPHQQVGFKDYGAKETWIPQVRLQPK